MQAKSPGLPATHHLLAEPLDFGNTVFQLETLTAERLALVPVSAIDELIGLLDGIAARIKTAQAEVTKTLTTRYAEQAKSQLLADGKDTGTTHIIDSEFDITVEVGKDVKYEPKGLADLVAKIEASGGDPREYIEIKYSVSEAKFKAWPQTLREPFERLRTVTPKAPKFTLRRVEGGAA